MSRDEFEFRFQASGGGRTAPEIIFINLFITCVHGNHVIHVSIIDHVIDNDHVIVLELVSRDGVGDTMVLKCTTERRGTRYHAVLITLIDLFRRNRHSQ